MPNLVENLIALDPEAQALLFREARTANAFTSDPVSEEQVKALYELVKWAPTALNAQPMRIVLVRSPEARARLINHMGPSNKVKTASAPLVAVLAADTDFHNHLPKIFPHFSGAKDMFKDDYAKRLGLATNNAWLQMGYFILGVRALGLAAGPMTGIDTAGIDADLLAGTSLKSIAVVNIGHPAPEAWFNRSPRLDYDEAVTTL
ncbi:MAG: malonic semialdehyde reductase [Actinomycetes bacterium]